MEQDGRIVFPQDIVFVVVDFPSDLSGDFIDDFLAVVFHFGDSVCVF